MSATNIGNEAEAQPPLSSIGSPATVINPVPMSFPQILRNSRLSDRFAYLRGENTSRSLRNTSLVAKRVTRDDREGKRWIRRKENAQFVGNPHVVQASRLDMSIEPPYVQRTFPEPLPRYLPRNLSAPSPQPPSFDAHSANAGRYSLSMKGVRRNLRQHGPRAQLLVRDVEHEVVAWLVGGTILAPDDESEVLLGVPGRPIGDGISITELSRTPLQLVWAIEQDAFARYIVHCCARYHKVVSYSKDVDGRRLTYLLRPNVTRPDYIARASLDTPPATELSDYSLGVLSESDILSVEENDALLSDAISDSEPPLRSLAQRRLSSVSERNSESDNDMTPRPLRTNIANTGSLQLVREAIGDDADDDESIGGDDLSQSIQSLDLNASAVIPEPPIRYAGPQMERTPLRDRRGISRAESSPSRSPRPSSRRVTRSLRPRMTGRRPVQRVAQSFYDYLYS